MNWAGGRLNSMVDRWKAERLTIWEDKRTGPFQLTSGQQTYTIGAGAAGPYGWVTPRPFWIDFAGLVQTVGGGIPVPEYPMAVLTDFEWAKTVTKTLQSSIPTALWYDRNFDANGCGTIYIWPVPTVANQVALYSPVPVDEFDIVNGLTNAINFPPGYRDLLMYSLAIRIAPTFGKQISQDTRQGKADAMEMVKTTNLRLDTLRVDDALVRKDGGYWNWLSDSFNYR